MESKWVGTSKTLWANMILAASTELLPSMQPWISSHPQAALLIISTLNVALRKASKTPIHFIPKGIK